MLNNKPAMAVLTTDSLDRARDFYVQTLGLELEQEVAGGIMLDAGMGTKFYVYEKPGVMKPDATVLGFNVENLEQEMMELRNKGIMFEEYDQPGLKTENGVAMMDGMKSAWFKDPDGNIINVAEMPMH